MKRNLIILFTLLTYLSYSQINDSISSLKTFTKTTNKIIKNGKFSHTNHISEISQIRNNENIGNILQSQSTNYLKSYGPGNLSSISSRGGNAQQTSLIYKDFVLNNPLNGIVDFSSIPMVFFNSIDIIYGLPSSNWGNGGLASAVILENKNYAENKFIEYGNVFGSFGQKTNFLNLGVKNSKISSYIKIFHQKITNDFRFNDHESQLKRQTNASINHLAFMGETNIYFNNKNNLSIVYFGQNLDREIPPSNYEGFTNAKQEDDNHRLFLNYTHLKSNSKWSFKTAYYNEENNYIDSVRSIYGYNPATSIINQLDFKTLLKSNHNITVNLTNSNSFSNGKNFNSTIELNRTALTGSYIYKKKTWQQLLNFRILLNEGEITPLTYSYALNKTLNNASIFLNFGKVFRLPSINDLFWNPGGNDNLSPEQGYSSDIGFKWKTKLNNTFLSFSSSIYSRNIEDWIQWYPSGGYWSAMNIKKVWSRGIETSSSIKSQFRAIDFKLDFKTSYNLSTNIEIFNGDKSTINKQLIYSPFYKGVINASISFKNLNLSYLHNYTGYRFTTNDNNSYLPSFHIGKIYLSSDILIKNQFVKIFYKIHNIYNVDYQLIINRPMPLINHEIGINIKIKK
jgi:iron complex outermembrane receptor protein